MFCRKCGNQLHDGAYICPSCGCLVEDRAEAEPIFETVPPAPAQPSKAQKVFYKLSHIFSKIGLIMNAVTFGFVVFAVILLTAGVPEGGATMAYMGFLIGAISAELSTAGFVFSLIQKVEPAQRRTSIPVFVVSLVLTVVAYVAFIVSVGMLGYEGVESFFYYYY